jgi:hypothetical protein
LIQLQTANYPRSPARIVYTTDTMAKPAELITVACPCCEAKLHIDPETKAVIRYEEHIRPPSIADFETAVNLHKNEAGRREDAFKKSVESQKTHQEVLNKKFDEMLKIARENPDEPPPKRDIDFD